MYVSIVSRVGTSFVPALNNDKSCLLNDFFISHLFAVGITYKKRKHNYLVSNTVDLVIFACLYFHKFLILELFTK